jgi:hypothetical protein
VLGPDYVDCPGVDVGALLTGVMAAAVVTPGSHHSWSRRSTQDALWRVGTDVAVCDVPADTDGQHSPPSTVEPVP